MQTIDREPDIHDHFDALRGRVCRLIESIGLTESRQQALIGTFKEFTYQTEKAVIERAEA